MVDRISPSKLRKDADPDTCQAMIPQDYYPQRPHRGSHPSIGPVLASSLSSRLSTLVLKPSHQMPLTRRLLLPLASPPSLASLPANPGFGLTFIFRSVSRRQKTSLFVNKTFGSLREAQKQRVQKIAKRNEGEKDFFGGNAAVKGTFIAGLLLIGVVGGFSAAGYMYKDQINDLLTQFAELIEGSGPAGYALFVAVYAGLEILALPAIPLTMAAGILFGSLTGTVIVSISGTLAASVSFLIARYLARDRILKLVEGNQKFQAIDRAIGDNGFRVVALLRLSPLLPFALGNYLYGLTSVEFLPYVVGSWLGTLPGTWAYVSAGAFGRAVIQEESTGGLPGGNGQLITLGIGLLITVLAASYVTKLAKDAMTDIE